MFIMHQLSHKFVYIVTEYAASRNGEEKRC